MLNQKNRIKRRFTTKADFPLTIGLSLTYKCNLRCEMCGQYGKNGNYLDGNGVDSNRVMELPFWCIEKLVSELKNKPKPLIYLWGGEPFLHTRILDIIKLLKKNNLIVHINTNGTFLEKYADEIIKLKPDVITISIDGPEEIHDKIRGVKGAFKQLKKGVCRINNLKNKNDALLLKAFCTITKDNINHLEEIPRIAKSLGLFYVSFIHLMFTDEKTGKKYEERFQEHFNEKPVHWKGFCTGIEKHIDTEILKNKIREVKKESGFWIKFKPELSESKIDTYYKNPSEFIKRGCLQAWCRTDIMPNGDVAACSDLPDFICGNIKEKKLEEIWNNEKYKQFREIIKKGDFPVCSRCCKIFEY